jgi:hypothetical protein
MVDCLLVCWCAGVLVYWCAGVLVCWCAGVLVCWCAGVLVCWCDAATRSLTSAATQSPRIRGPYLMSGFRSIELCFSVWAAHFAAGTRQPLPRRFKGLSIVRRRGGSRLAVHPVSLPPLIMFAKLPVKVICPGLVSCLKVNSRWCYGQVGTRVWAGRWRAVTFVVTGPGTRPLGPSRPSCG